MKALLTILFFSALIAPVQTVTVTYGWSLVDPYRGDRQAVTVSNPATVTIQHNADIPVKYGPEAADNFIILKVPSGESLKTTFNNGSGGFVGGPIEGSEFREPFTVSGFTYYVSRHRLAFDYKQPLNFIR